MVDCTGLENQRACKRSVGSNPTPSATWPKSADDFPKNLAPAAPSGKASLTAAEIFPAVQPISRGPAWRPRNVGRRFRNNYDRLQDRCLRRDVPARLEVDNRILEQEIPALQECGRRIMNIKITTKGLVFASIFIKKRVLPTSFLRLLSRGGYPVVLSGRRRKNEQ